MIAKGELYNNFDGYNAYPLVDADRIIRYRFRDMCGELLDLVNQCYIKSKETGREKIQANIEPVRSRIARIKKEIEERELSYVPPYIKEGITGIDENAISEIDHAVAGIFNTAFSAMSELSCDEEYTNIIQRFTQINSLLRDLENKCHERMRVLKRG